MLSHVLMTARYAGLTQRVSVLDVARFASRVPLIVELCVLGVRGEDAPPSAQECSYLSGKSTTTMLVLARVLVRPSRDVERCASA